MRVRAPSNKSRLEIEPGLKFLGKFPRINNLSLHGSTCSPACLSSSATSLQATLSSEDLEASHLKTSDLSSFDRTCPSLLSMLRLTLDFPLLSNVVRYAICESIHPGHVRRRMYVNEGRQSILCWQYKQPATDMFPPLCPILYNGSTMVLIFPRLHSWFIVSLLPLLCRKICFYQSFIQPLAEVWPFHICIGLFGQSRNFVISLQYLHGGISVICNISNRRIQDLKYPSRKIYCAQVKYQI